MTHPSDDTEECIYEGRLAEIFKGFRNHDTLFKVQGGGTWRQDEYKYEYHYLYTPKVRIFRVQKKGNPNEVFYLEVEGVKTRVKVKSAYL